MSCTFSRNTYEQGQIHRKRQRTEEKAEQQADSVRLADAEVVSNDHQTKRTKVSHPNGNEQEKGNMVPREIPKGNTLTNWLLVIFTGLLTSVAGFQWFVTYRQLAVMRNDQRAWVQVQQLPVDEKNPKVDIAAGKLIQVPVKITNTGKTPARNVELRLAVEVVPASDAPDFHCVERSSCPDDINLWGILFPSETDAMFGRRWTWKGLAPVATDTDASAWQQEKVYLAIYGMVVYDDVYKVHHWTRFCYWQNYPDNGEHTHFHAKDCTEYNSVDGG